LKVNIMGMTACIAYAAITFIAVALLRIPLVWVLLGVGSVACAFAYRRMGLTASQGLDTP
jgi:chromate transporter